MDTEVTDPATGQPKKAPRQPRPSEIAAKKAKAAAKRKAKAKSRPKSKKKAVKRKPAKKTAKRKAGKSKTKARPLVRTERLDMRITKAQRAKVVAKAKRRKQTITVVVLEAIDKLR